MEQFFPLVLQVIAGALGGNATGAAAKNLSLGSAGNSLAGAIGGGVLGQVLQMMAPLLNGAGADGFDGGAIAANLIAGGVAGAVVTALVGVVKRRTAIE